MSSVTDSNPERLDELLAGKVLGDLSLEEGEELQRLTGGKSLPQERELEQAAAALQLAFETDDERQLPIDLREQISRRAVEVIESLPVHAPSSVRATGLGENVTPRKKETLANRELLAWIAVAASLLIAVGAWVGRPGGGALVRPNPAGPVAKSPSELRSELLANAEDAIQIPWAGGKTPFENEVSGDVVWSNDKQTGYLRFVGMPVNDPTIEQYQLWIIDPKRDEEPIDGGVFDIDESGEVTVAIDAKLRVLEPAAFAITIEQPGGVVVSTQQRLPLIAAIH